MALDIVYGYQGKDHVKASQLGRLLAGTFGGGRYVLDTQDGLAAEMQTANTVRIGTGDLVMDNRYMTNEAYVDLTVDSGQSGYNRNDLVCAKYERAAGDDPDHSVEDVEFVVLKGTPTTGEATDPTYTAGDISAQDATAIYPLWRLPIEGLTVGEPVQLFEKLQTYSSFWDSVSREFEEERERVNTDNFRITFRKPSTNNGIWFDDDETSACIWFNDEAVGVWNAKTNSGFTLRP